ncbi:hypothetical protein [Citrobacter sp. RHBSTW-00881]|uniref:hypothetical protein n=1 Tax=Citrobacter sp. RHBSTW-00881 TaxID=2742667 RepID=UPI002E121041
MKQKSLYIAIVLALHCAVAVADNSIDSTQIDEVTVNGDGNNISGLTPCATPSNCKSPLGNSSVSGNNNTITSLTNYIITGSNNDLSFREGANKRGNSSRLTQSFHFFMFEPIFSPVNALNQPI